MRAVEIDLAKHQARDHDIWNPNFAFCHAHLASNSNGEVGISVGAGGGGSDASPVAGFLGDNTLSVTDDGRGISPAVLERIWVVGDTPLDVRCARSIGARAVAVATGWHSHDELAEHAPDLLLTDLSDPQPLLSRWFIG